jgi:UDP-N-acetyl-D-glucosamine dehydrogenase
MSVFDLLNQKIGQKEVAIGIVGLGYVGQPLAFNFVTNGIKVIGFDINQQRVDLLNKGQSDITHLEIDKTHDNKIDKFIATTDFQLVEEVDVIILCLPTPLSKNLEPDLSFVTNSLDTIIPHMKEGQIICLESTTWPGTTDELIIPRLQNVGFEVGNTVFVAYSPEREDPGNKFFNTANIPKIVGGATEHCRLLAKQVYSLAIETVIETSSLKVAEMTKILENIYRSINIGLVNELKIVCDAMDIDIFEVIDAAKTKPFGFQAFYPGPGLGGHCIPIDPFYLSWKAREFGVNSQFIELAGQINRQMPKYSYSQINKRLNNYQKSIKGSKILLIGMAYKKDVDDMRESPSVEILKLLENNGAYVDYHDPYIPVMEDIRNYGSVKTSVVLTDECIKSYDLVVICTDHSNIDYVKVLKHAVAIYDTRGVLKKIKL